MRWKKELIGLAGSNTHFGYSNVGTIVEVGSEVKGYEVGERVFSSASHRQYHINGDPYIVRIPADISDETAAWSKLGSIAQTGVWRAKMEMGDKVVVIGLGPMGQLVTQYARIMAESDVLAIDGYRIG